MTARKKEQTPVPASEEAAIPVAIQEMYAEQAGAGLEEADADSFAIPFLKLLQKLSPEVDEAEPTFIEDARPGMFFNSVTRELYPSDVHLVPCYFQRRFLEWAPRASGGGFKGAHSVSEASFLHTTPDENDRPTLDNGNLLSDTREHYCLLVKGDGKTWEPVIVSLSITQLKRSRKWNYIMQAFVMDNGRPYPTFSRVYKAAPEMESNAKGSWYGWNITPAGMVRSEPLFRAAIDFRDAIASGAAQAADPDSDIPATAEEDDIDF